MAEPRVAAAEGAASAGRPHVTQVRVRYAETDQMGVAYYANYLVWFEVARADWLRAAGLTYRQLEADGLFLPVIEAHCEYRAPVRYDDALAVRAAARLASPARLAFDYDITGPGGPVATGSTVHALLDGRGRPVRVPAAIKDLIG
jgi:acyl-CoA thioester hydrolase